jgi:hypothetical protein
LREVQGAVVFKRAGAAGHIAATPKGLLKRQRAAAFMP